MTASALPKTPTMKLPLRESVSDSDNEAFIKQVSRLTLSQAVERVTVTERLSGREADARLRKYTVLLDFYPSAEYCTEYQVTLDRLHESLAFNFASRLKREIMEEMRLANRTVTQDLHVGQGLRVRGDDLAEDEDGQAGRRVRDDELDDDDGDAYQAKRQAQARQHEYEDDDNEDSGIADLEDHVEQRVAGDDEHDAMRIERAGEDADETMDVDATEKAQADARADLLRDQFILLAKYATSFSFDVHGGQSAQFDLEVSDDNFMSAESAVSDYCTEVAFG